MSRDISWKPTPKQTLALQTTAKMILFGGGRGSGKTDAGIVWNMRNINNPDFRGLVIRKNAVDLTDWVSRATLAYTPFGAKRSGTTPVFKFPSGAMIYTGHLADANSYTKYQGHEYHAINIEELTHIPTLLLFQQLMGSLRSTVPGLTPQFFGTANPGGIGHEWVKEYWKIGYNDGKKFEEDGITKIYIPSNIDDNPHLRDADPDYVKYLDSLPPDLMLKWRKGDWNDHDSPAQFYATYLTKAKENNRITSVPFNSSLKTYMSFDLGMRDQMVIWIAQIHGKEVRIVHCYANRNLPLKHYADYVSDLRLKYGFRIEKCFVPHDANVRSMTDDTSRFERLQQLGFNVELAPMVDVASGIDTVRDLLTHCWIDQENCKDGLRALRQYHREFDDKNNRYKNNPEHDWASDYADSFRYLALGLSKNMITYTIPLDQFTNNRSWQGA